MANLAHCRDPRGQKDCFGCRVDGRSGRTVCVCLKETDIVPCPFYKPTLQVLKEDPDFYNRQYK